MSAGGYTTDARLQPALVRFAAAAGRALAGRCEPPQELLQLLAEEAEWRVFVDGSKNLGHQASTVLLLRRLIELTGFAGRVVVVWADHGRAVLGRTADKLALLWPGLDAGQLDRAVMGYRSCREIRFLPLADAVTLTEPVVFGFTGGADDLDFNGAAALNVGFFMRVQPYRWDDPPARRALPYYQCSRIEQPDDRHLYPLEACAALRTLPLRHAPPAHDGEPLPPGPGAALWRVHAQADALWWPVYGLQHHAQAAPHVMLSCALLAMVHAHRAGRPVVLCAFSPATPGPRATALLERMTRGGLADPLASTLRAWCDAQAPGVRLALHTAADDGAHFAGLARALRERRSVHVVDIGPVPMDVFHRFVGSADLPCVIEGQATANWLVGLGRPFLQLVRDDAGWLGDGEEGPPDALDAAAQAIGAMRYGDGGIGAEMQAQLARWSALLEGTAASTKGPSATGDKLAVMLLALREVMLQE